MNKQFVDLFDVKKYGFNYWAAIGLFLGCAASWFFGNMSNWLLWKSYKVYIFTWGDILGVQYLSTSILYWFVFALTFVGLSHIFKKDAILPLIAGLVMVLWGIQFSSILFIAGLSGSVPFDIHSIAMNFSWMFVTIGAVILFFRFMGNKLGTFLIAFCLSEFLAQVLVSLIYSQPIRFFIIRSLMGILGGFVTGLLFYAGLSYHLKKRRISLEEEKVMAPEVPPIAPAEIQIPQIPKFISKRNLSMGWSFQWRMGLCILAVSGILTLLLMVVPEGVRRVLFFERSRTPVGSGQELIYYWFIGSPIIAILFVNWVAKVIVRKRYKLFTTKFVGWSVWWRIVLLNLAGFIPLMILAFLIPVLFKGRLESGFTFMGLFFLLYIPFWIVYIINVSGFAIHRLFRIIPKERWSLKT